MKQMLTSEDKIWKEYKPSMAADRRFADFQLWNRQYERNEKLLRIRSTFRSLLLIIAAAGCVAMAAHLSGIF